MEILYIIGFGWIVNIMTFFLTLFFILMDTIINLRNPKYILAFAELEKIGNKIKFTRMQLRKKKITWVTQESFVILIPFSGILTLIDFLTTAPGHGIPGYLIMKLQIILDKLEARL